jgi:hypothetical protein
MPIDHEKVNQIQRRWGVNSRKELSSKVDKANSILRRTQRLASVGLVDTVTSLKEVLEQILESSAHALYSDASSVATWVSENLADNEEDCEPRGIKGLEYFANQLDSGASALVELNPERDIQSTASVNPVYFGNELNEHIHVLTTDAAATSATFMEVGFQLSLQSGAAPAVAPLNGACFGHGLRAVIACVNAAPTGTPFVLTRNSGHLVNCDFVVRCHAAAAAQYSGAGAITATASNPPVVDENLLDAWVVSTEAQMLAFAQGMTVGGKTSKSIRVVTANNRVTATCYFTISQTTQDIALGGVAHDADAAASVLWIEMEPLRLKYRGDAPLVGYDSTGNSTSGRELGDLVGTVHPGAYKSLGVSDSTDRFLRFLSMCNRLQLRSNGQGGSSYAFSKLMEDMLNDQLQIAIGTYDSDFWFDLGRVLSNDSAATDAETRQAYVLWYKSLSTFIGVIRTDTRLASAFEQDNMSDILLI